MSSLGIQALKLILYFKFYFIGKGSNFFVYAFHLVSSQRFRRFGGRSKDGGIASTFEESSRRGFLKLRWT